MDMNPVAENGTSTSKANHCGNTCGNF